MGESGDYLFIGQIGYDACTIVLEIFFEQREPFIPSYEYGHGIDMRFAVFDLIGVQFL